ncbi:MAG TPA: type II toxin-antitoxin system RelE/ParE family toxin [Polyangiaceae bacterium]
MKLRLSELAQQQIEEIDAWWREHREAAPLLFREELREAILQIEANPELGTPYRKAAKPYRWVLLPKTRYLLYYELDEATGVRGVATLWNARRGSGPKL